MIIDNQNKAFIEKMKELKESNDWTNIIILWDVGVGKTFISKKIFHDAYFINEWTFKQHLSSWILKLCPPEQWASKKLYPLEMLCRSWIVIYDDLWVADITEAYIDKMMYWLDERLSKNKKTIFTTNLTLKDLDHRDKRIASRIQQNSKILLLSWDDRRKLWRDVIRF